MQYRKQKRRSRLWITGFILILITIIILSATSTNRSEYLVYGFDRQIPQSEQDLRLSYVATAKQWLGYKESNGTHKQIIDLYNSHTPLAQGYRVKYDDEWCATFVSAAAIEAQLTQIIPTECGCQRQIDLFEKLETWQEDDRYIPLPGDIIYYCRQNSSNLRDCTGWADHVGIVVGTNGNRIKVIEGNYGDQVAYRYIRVDDPIIRGYAIPDYALLVAETP